MVKHQTCRKILLNLLKFHDNAPLQFEARIIRLIKTANLSLYSKRQIIKKQINPDRQNSESDIFESTVYGSVT